MNTETKKSTYTEAQKKATKKYRENNKEKVNLQRKKYYQNRKAKDPNFLLYKRTKAKEYYAKKKERALKTLEEVKEEFKTAIPIPLITEPIVDVEKPKPEPTPTPTPEPKPEKKKRIYKSKK